MKPIEKQYKNAREVYEDAEKAAIKGVIVDGLHPCAAKKMTNSTADEFIGKSPWLLGQDVATQRRMQAEGNYIKVFSSKEAQDEWHSRPAREAEAREEEKRRAAEDEKNKNPDIQRANAFRLGDLERRRLHRLEVRRPYAGAVIENMPPPPPPQSPESWGTYRMWDDVGEHYENVNKVLSRHRQQVRADMAREEKYLQGLQACHKAAMEIFADEVAPPDWNEVFGDIATEGVLAIIAETIFSRGKKILLKPGAVAALKAALRHILFEQQKGWGKVRAETERCLAASGHNDAYLNDLLGNFKIEEN